MGKFSLIFNGLQWKLFPWEELQHLCDCFVGGLRHTEVLINFPDLTFCVCTWHVQVTGTNVASELPSFLLLLHFWKCQGLRRKTFKGQEVPEAKFSASSFYDPLTSAVLWGVVGISLSASVTQEGLPAWLTGARKLSAGFCKKVKLFWAYDRQRSGTKPCSGRLASLVSQEWENFWEWRRRKATAGVTGREHVFLQEASCILCTRSWGWDNAGQSS